MSSKLRTYKGDLHIHTQLSPCGSLDNSPQNIVYFAKEQGLDFIGIADHNTTRQASIVVEIGKQNGLTVFPGVEVNTKEEVHCVCLFPDVTPLAQMQNWLDERLPNMENKPEYFGFQVQVDANDNIVYSENRFLHAAIHASINEVCDYVHQLGGLFFPAHIDRRGNSLLRQLGMIPDNLNFDALEIFRATNEADIRSSLNLSKNIAVLKNSDAHYPYEIGRAYSLYELDALNFNAVRNALRQKDHCKVTHLYLRDV